MALSLSLSLDYIPYLSRNKGHSYSRETNSTNYYLFTDEVIIILILICFMLSWPFLFLIQPGSFPPSPPIFLSPSCKHAFLFNFRVYLCHSPSLSLSLSLSSSIGYTRLVRGLVWDEHRTKGWHFVMGESQLCTEWGIFNLVALHVPGPTHRNAKDYIDVASSLEKGGQNV